MSDRIEAHFLGWWATEGVDASVCGGGGGIGKNRWWLCGHSLLGREIGLPFSYFSGVCESNVVTKGGFDQK